MNFGYTKSTSTTTIAIATTTTTTMNTATYQNVDGKWHDDQAYK